MSITWKKDKVTKYIPLSSAATGPTQQQAYELEVYQGDTIDLFKYLQFTDDGKNKDYELWKKSLVNAAYYTDNAASQTAPFENKFESDDEIYQYASKYALDWKCEIAGAPDPLGIANALVNKYGILDTSISGIGVDMKLHVWPNWGKQANQYALKDPTAEGPNTEIEFLTVIIKSNSFLGEGGLLNPLTGSIDKFVSDATAYVSSAFVGALGQIGSGAGWAVNQVASLFPKTSPGYDTDEARRKKELEKDSEVSMFSKIIGLPVDTFNFLTDRQNAEIVKNGLRAVSLAAKLYRAYTQGKTEWATAVLLANLRSLLDYDKLKKPTQIKIAKFLGTNPETIIRIIFVVKKIIEIEALVKKGDYDALQKLVLDEARKYKEGKLDPQMQEFVSGEAFSDLALGSVVEKNLKVIDQNTLELTINNPSYRAVEGNNLVLTSFKITSRESGGIVIPLESVTSKNFENVKAGSFFVQFNSDYTECTVLLGGVVGTEVGASPVSNGLFPNGSDVLTIKLFNDLYTPLYEGGNKIKRGVIPIDIEYNFLGNSEPVMQKTVFNRALNANEKVYEQLPVILARNDETKEKIGYNLVIPGSYASYKDAKFDEDVETGVEYAKNALEIYNTYKKEQFLKILDAVDFKNLPKPVQGFIFTTAGFIGIDQVVRYYEVLSGAKNLYELSTKGFHHYDSLPPELKKKISKQLGVSEDVLGDVLPLAGDITDLVTGKRFKTADEKKAFLESAYNKYGKQLLDKWGPDAQVWKDYNGYVYKKVNGVNTKKVIPGGGKLDPKMKQTIAVSMGFNDMMPVKPDEKGQYKKDANGKDITHADQDGLAIRKCGMAIHRALEFKEKLGAAINIKNRILKKYEAFKNTDTLSALENEQLLLGTYDDVVDTREAFEKDGIFQDLFDSAVDLSQDPYADLKDAAGKLPPGVPGAGDPNWRETFEVENKYVVEIDGVPQTPGGVTGTLNYGTYSIWTYDWVQDIVQDPVTGEPKLVGTPPAGFVYKSSDTHWEIDVTPLSPSAPPGSTSRTTTSGGQENPDHRTATNEKINQQFIGGPPKGDYQGSPTGYRPDAEGVLQSEKILAQLIPKVNGSGENTTLSVEMAQYKGSEYFEDETWVAGYLTEEIKNTMRIVTFTLDKTGFITFNGKKFSAANIYRPIYAWVSDDTGILIEKGEKKIQNFGKENLVFLFRQMNKPDVNKILDGWGMPDRTVAFNIPDRVVPEW